MNRTDIELFKEILKDDAIHFTVAQIVRVTVAKNRSVVTLECIDTVEGHELVCSLSFDSVGMNTASGDLPDPKDLILVAYSNSNINQAYALKRLPSKEEPIPKQMLDGDTVFMARPGKTAHLTSDTQINIGLGDYDNPPDEPLLLGGVVQQLFKDMFDQLQTLSTKVADLAGQVSNLADATKSHTHGYIDNTGNPPVPTPSTTDPTTGAPFSSVKSAADGIQSDAQDVESSLSDLHSSPINNGDILSDLAFTEKGG